MSDAHRTFRPEEVACDYCSFALPTACCYQCRSRAWGCEPPMLICNTAPAIGRSNRAGICWSRAISTRLRLYVFIDPSHILAIPKFAVITLRHAVAVIMTNLPDLESHELALYFSYPPDWWREPVRRAGPQPEPPRPEPPPLVAPIAPTFNEGSSVLQASSTSDGFERRTKTVTVTPSKDRTVNRKLRGIHLFVSGEGHSPFVSARYPPRDGLGVLLATGFRC